ncbi:MAG: DeoR family transcriptional regulator [Dehalococcoidales bacterium]|nr:DeoR family transcriptional regulator [Dehalococcoidales bacterium]
MVSKNDSGAVDKLGNLIRLAEVVGEIKPVNSEVLQRELKGFNLAIAELIGNAEEVNLEETFPNKEVKENKVEGVSINKENKQFGNRQSAILEFIRQLPNGCRMRDLVIKFPQVSERTLRNDLQSLTDQSLIERVGSQGPFSFFRAVTKKELIAL